LQPKRHPSKAKNIEYFILKETKKSVERYIDYTALMSRYNNLIRGRRIQNQKKKEKEVDNFAILSRNKINTTIFLLKF
jgi:hypothetical protein